MNARVTRLRQETIDTKPWLSIERAALLTEFYQKDKTVPVPIRRARALQYLMENKEIYIGSEDLIVGERGSGPKACLLYTSRCV